uniref:Uncharacterized protein n=1 Tax=Oryza barthii TaxID=65489 RepID=A0A0D3EP70_9ORYZ
MEAPTTLAGVQSCPEQTSTAKPPSIPEAASATHDDYGCSITHWTYLSKRPTIGHCAQERRNVQSSLWQRKDARFLCEGMHHVLKDNQLSLVLAKAMRDQKTTLQPVRQLMAVSNNSSNTSVLPLAPSAVATHSDSNNIVTKVMSSLLCWEHAQREECTSKIHQQSLQDYRISTSRADEARKSVIYFSCGETAQFFSSDCNQCLKHQTSMWLSTSAMHLILLQFKGTTTNSRNPHDVSRKLAEIVPYMGKKYPRIRFRNV